MGLYGAVSFQTASIPAGGASAEDLRALSQQNVSMDLATFKKLQMDALLVSGDGNSGGRAQERHHRKWPGLLRKACGWLGGPYMGWRAFCGVEPQEEGLV